MTPEIDLALQTALLLMLGKALTANGIKVKIVDTRREGLR